MQKKNTILSIAWLVALTLLAFVYLVTGRSFLYDDLYFVRFNPELSNVHGFWDCFHFSLQPSKPVTNFFMAFSHLIFKGRVTGHRIVSFSLHLLNVILFFCLLLRLQKRIKLPLFPCFALVAASLYAILPVHTEVLGVSQFRGDLLAAGFAFLSLLLTLRLKENEGRPGMWWANLVGLVLAMGLAELSKEVYAVALPLLVVFFYRVDAGGSILWDRSPHWKTFIGVVLLAQVLSSAGLYTLIKKDADGPYSYTQTIGAKVFTPAVNVQMVGRSLLEGIWKPITGRNLTIKRPAQRLGIGKDWSWPIHTLLIFLALGLVGLAWWAKGWWRIGAVLYFSVTWLYLAIPNFNLGSEHYTYLPSAGIILLVLTGISWLLKKTEHANLLWWVVVGSYGFLLFMNVENRCLEMHTRTAFVEAELNAHPESASSWIDVADNMFDEKAPTEKIWPLVHRAAELENNYAPTVMMQWKLSYTDKDFNRLPGYIKQLLAAPIPNRYKGLMLGQYALLALDFGYCSESRRSMEEALRLDPTAPNLVGMNRDIASSIEQKRVKCIPDEKNWVMKN